MVILNLAESGQCRFIGKQISWLEANDQFISLSEYLIKLWQEVHELKEAMVKLRAAKTNLNLVRRLVHNVLCVYASM